MHKRKSSSEYHKKSKKPNINSNAASSCVKLYTKEEDVYITEYISDFIGFSGIIKQRFSDFQVNEIDEFGSVVHLTSLEVPVISSDLSCDDENEISKLITQENCKKISALYDQRTIPVTAIPIEIDVTDLTKLDREKIHKWIVNQFSGSLRSSTCKNENDKSVMKIEIAQKQDDRTVWPPGFPSHLHFVLYKENMDTTDTIYHFSKRLRVKCGMIAHAGTKDKRGKTVQRMSVKRIRPSRLLTCATRNIKVGNFDFKDYPLRLGQLYGNRFRIALRNVKEDDKFFENVMESFKSKGFINYYGLQRFGYSSLAPTYLIGKYLVRQQWKEAVDIILEERLSDRMADLAEAREVWKSTGDAEKTFNCLRGRRHTTEGKILLTLAAQGENAYVNALQAIPRNALLLYIHSYQSLIWNRVVSRRIKELGRLPIVGDLIINEEDVAMNEELEVDVDEEEDKEDDQVENDRKDKKKVSVRAITQEDVDSVNIKDIVYPLPGYDVQFPNNVTKTWYEEALKEDGITCDMFKQKNKTFSMCGAYRKIVNLPQDVNWYIMGYNDPSADLLLSDDDLLMRKPPIVDIPDGKYKALILELSLTSSSYATMAIRELTKNDTSSSYQASLSSAHTDTSIKSQDSLKS